MDTLLNEAGRMGWETTGTEAFDGQAGLERAIKWARARLSWSDDARVRAWLARALGAR